MKHRCIAIFSYANFKIHSTPSLIRVQPNSPKSGTVGDWNKISVAQTPFLVLTRWQTH